MSAYWALENPHRSFLWLLPVLLMLWNVGGVGFVHFTMKSYGLACLKPTVILTNVPTFVRLNKPIPEFASPFVLRGQICFEGMWQFMTALACPYPPALGMTVGELTAEALQLRDEARKHGEDVPMLLPCNDMGNPMLQAMFDMEGHMLDEAVRFCDDGKPGELDELKQEGGVEFEPDSGGAWKGMSTEEHMKYAENMPHHGHKAMDINVPEELRRALDFC